MTIDALSNSNYVTMESKAPQGGTTSSSQDASTTTSGNSAAAQQNASDSPSSKLQKMMDTWKAQSVQPNLSVQFDSNEPTNQIWLNLVDQTTGKVVMKLPPEALRMMVQHNQAAGLVTDVQT